MNFCVKVFLHLLSVEVKLITVMHTDPSIEPSVHRWQIVFLHFAIASHIILQMIHLVIIYLMKIIYTVWNCNYICQSGYWAWRSSWKNRDRNVPVSNNRCPLQRTEPVQRNLARLQTIGRWPTSTLDIGHWVQTAWWLLVTCSIWTMSLVAFARRSLHWRLSYANSSCASLTSKTSSTNFPSR